MKSVLSYLKIWSDDFTASIYLSKILGLILTLAYFIFTLNKDKAKYFNRKNNYFLNLRQKLIQKYIKPFDDKFNADFLRGDRYDFNGVYLPKMESTYQVRMVYDDLLKIYTEYGDNYDYKLVDELDKKCIKFALSNITRYNGNKNNLLIKWMKKYRVHKIKSNYINYHNNKQKKINEVLVTNY